MTADARPGLIVEMRARVETTGLPPHFVRTGEDAERVAHERHAGEGQSSVLWLLDEKIRQWTPWRTVP